MPFYQSPQIRMIFARADALSAALTCVERGCGHEKAVQLVEDVFGPEPADDYGKLVHAAMAHIIDRPIMVSLQGGETDDQRIFDAVGRAWIAWATGLGRANARKTLQDVPVPKGPRMEGGALHLMAMHPWAQAVTALLQDDLVESRRLFRRATELSSQCGIETNSAIQWTYAASYFGK